MRGRQWRPSSSTFDDRQHVEAVGLGLTVQQRERALADEKVRATLNGKQVVKAIVVPGKLVNIVA
mgnify:CR=1 FL=1